MTDRRPVTELGISELRDVYLSSRLDLADVSFRGGCLIEIEPIHDIPTDTCLVGISAKDVAIHR